MEKERKYVVSEGVNTVRGGATKSGGGVLQIESEKRTRGCNKTSWTCDLREKISSRIGTAERATTEIDIFYWAFHHHRRIRVWVSAKGYKTTSKRNQETVRVREEYLTGQRTTRLGAKSHKEENKWA